MKILITGSAGLIGSEAAVFLPKKGIRSLALITICAVIFSDRRPLRIGISGAWSKGSKAVTFITPRISATTMR